MDMKALYQQIREDARPEVVEIEGRKYSTHDLKPVYDPVQKNLHVTTLTGLKNYIESKVDELVKSEILLHVFSPTEVFLVSKVFGEFKQRATLITAEASTLPYIKFNSFMESEAFTIQTQACFMDSHSRPDVLAYSGNARQVLSAELSDDGVTQAVAVRNGVSSKEKKALPNPVTLQPFRTFMEVEQPASAFVFRAQGVGKDDSQNISFGLWEADGGAWKMIAMQRIKAWLEENIPGVDVIA